MTQHRYSAQMRDILMDLLRRGDRPAFSFYDHFSKWKEHGDGLSPTERKAAKSRSRQAVKLLEARGDLETYTDNHPDWEEFTPHTQSSKVLFARLTEQGKANAEAIQAASDAAEAKRLAKLQRDDPKAYQKTLENRAALDALAAQMQKLR
ncbi:MAG: hypothetical protein ABJX32_06195 [Tateyamaria sp.]|uniref:hypothetical protein n=1 Tax=Tateyamaria sp. TaxID=1929288 RepID=UPI00329CC397